MDPPGSLIAPYDASQIWEATQADPEAVESDDDNNSYNEGFESDEDYDNIDYGDVAAEGQDADGQGRDVQFIETTTVDPNVLQFRETPRGQLLSRRDQANLGPKVVIHRGYQNMLGFLCNKTDTACLIPLLLDIVPKAVAASRNSELHKLLTSGQSSHAATAMLIYVWLTLCTVYSIGARPPPKRSPITTLCGSYWLSSFAALCENYKVSDSKYLETLVLHWEDHMLSTLLPPNELDDSASWLSDHVSDIRALALKNSQMPPRNAEAKRYLKYLLNGGICALTDDIVDEDILDRSKTLTRLFQHDADMMEVVTDQTFYMFCTMGEYVLESLIRGRICQDFCMRGSPVRKALMANSWSEPSTCMNALADLSGVVPTIAQRRQVCDVMEDYVDTQSPHHERAHEIDTMISPLAFWSLEKAKRGYRRYVDRRDRKKAEGIDDSDDAHLSRDTVRRSTIRAFIENMRERLKAEAQTQGEHFPMRQAVIEIGYATNPRRRFKAHLEHPSSNYVMNLAEAVFAHLFPSKFQLLQFVLNNCWEPLQCWLGEIFLTILGQSYIKGAGGFNHHEAGLSNGAAYSRTRYITHWDQYIARVRESPEFNNTVKVHRERWDVHGAKIQQIAEKRVKLLALKKLFDMAETL